MAPQRKVSVAGTDISYSAIATQVELNENAISTVTFTANDALSKAFLKTLHVNDEVTVQFAKNSNPPFTANYKTVFGGAIQELSPILTATEQVCGVIAYGKGFQMKKMRAALEVGYIYPAVSWAYPYSFDNVFDNWASDVATHGWTGSPPYVAKYSGLTNVFGIGTNPSFIACGLDVCTFPPTGNNNVLGAWTFSLSPDYNGGQFSVLELHLVVGLTQDSASNTGAFPTSVTITPSWTTDTGASPTWHSFTGSPSAFVVSGTNLAFDVVTSTYWDGYNGGTYGSGIPAIWSGYNPPVNYTANGPPLGVDMDINIVGNIPYWNGNFKIKLQISSFTSANGQPVGGVTVALMYLRYLFNDTSGYTVRQLLTGEQGNMGLIPNFVNNRLNTVSSSGYPTPINTDYVVMDSYNASMTNGYGETNADFAESLIPYVKFPYEDCLSALQDIIKYESALQFLQNSVGYHWINDPDGNLLVAPVNNHHVWGASSSYYVDSKWVLKPYATPFIVKQSMITQQFKQEPPIFNDVLVAGKFRCPLNDDICRGKNQGSWIEFTTLNGLIDVSAAPSMSFSSYYDAETPQPSIYFQPHLSTSGMISHWIYPLTPSQTSIIDFTKLMGKHTVPSVNFWFRWGGNTSAYELRLYVDDGTGNPYLPSFFTAPISNNASQDGWGYVSIDFPNVVYKRDYGSWKLKTDLSNIFTTAPVTLEWSDMAKIRYISIACVGYSIEVGTPYVMMYGLSFNGTVIREAYDSLSILGDGTAAHPAYGCRQTTIKDSFAQTDSLSSADTTSPLTLESIYDLQRYRKIRTTGEIAIKLDPAWMAGQQIWIQTEYNPNYTNPSTSTHYKIDKWFRITKVTHLFGGKTGALTKLSLTDDLTSSLTVDTSNVYTTLMRKVNPDFQSRTFGSLKSNADFDLGLPILSLDCTSYTS